MERFYDVLRSQRFSNMEYVMFLGILSFFFLLGNVSLTENYEFDFEFLKLRKEQDTLVDNSQKYRLQYWATRLSVRSFTRTAHSFACFARGLLNAHLLVHSLTQ